MIRNVARLTIFRFMPIFLKEYFFISELEFASSITLSVDKTRSLSPDSNGYVAVELFNKIKDSGLNYISDKVYNYYHFMGAHFPYHITEQCEYSYNETTKSEQLKGQFHLLDEFIKSLKKKGVYDNSTIIVLSDHGDYEFEKKGNAGILFMIKEKNKVFDNIQINDFPITFHELAPTIISEATLEPSTYGDTVFDIVDKDRLREIYKYYSKDPKYIGAGSHDSFLKLTFDDHVDNIELSNDDLDIYEYIRIYDCLYK